MTRKNSITINDIARAAGVSKTTVSRYINGHMNLVSDTTRERIKSVIEMTNYHPSELARNLKKTTTNIIGVIISDISAPFMASLICGISDYLENIGYSPLFVNCNGNLETEKQAISSLIFRGVSGVLVITSSYENNFIVEQAAKGLPIVLCDRYIKDHNFDIVAYENEEIMCEILSHLKNSGYTRVAIFSEKINNNSTRIRRTHAFSAGMQKVYGYQADADIYEVKRSDENLVTSSLQLFLKKLRPDDIPAVIGINSFTTILLFKAIKRIGMSVPNEIGVCGPEDIGWNSAMNWPNLISPSITTFDLEPQIMGKKAAELLVSKINNPSKPIEEILIHNKLTIRESTQREP